ncbi:MAG: metallophosphoesterase [Clostridia bacterium]|nr:metallophosphoesterase [Clostridia bacterium]
MWTTEIENGIKIRDVVIETQKGGKDVEIVQLTDLHIAWMNDADMADSTLCKTYEQRKWAHIYENRTDHLDLTKRVLEHFKDADKIVITGDIYDFLTSETAIQANKHIFSAYGNLMACLGNHEVATKMGDEHDYSKEEWQALAIKRIASFDKCWNTRVAYNSNESIYYSSEVIENKVMLIQMDNATAGEFWDCQIEPFKNDLARAREEGYAVLIFYHIPIATGNPKYQYTETLDRGDVAYKNFYNSYSDTVSNQSTGASKEIYELIVRNGDIIKGAFCGHLHSDFYMEINATTENGTHTVIPQYVLKGSIYDKGNAVRITVK